MPTPDPSPRPRRRDRLGPVRPLYCRECGYRLAGLGGDVCPECGVGFDVEDASTVRRRPLRAPDRVARALGRARWWRKYAFALLPALLGVLAEQILVRSAELPTGGSHAIGPGEKAALGFLWFALGAVTSFVALAACLVHDAGEALDEAIQRRRRR